MSSECSFNSISCPLCPFKGNSPEIVEIHFNTEHEDLLTPKPTYRLKSSGPKPIKKQKNVCKYCRNSFNDKKSLAAHVNYYHFENSHSDYNRKTCPVCKESTNNLKDHIEVHFTPTPDREVQYFNQKGDYKERCIDKLRSDTYSGKISVADFYNRKIDLLMAESAGFDVGDSCTKDVAGKFRHLADSGTNIKLCTYIDHYAANFGDQGWGCGYRNIQMLMSSLLQDAMFTEVLNEKSLSGVPSIERIQNMIEFAWQNGFDKVGMLQLKEKLIGTKKWIGATEAVALLNSWKIKTVLIDCYPRSSKYPYSHTALFQWVKNYFEKDSSFKHPLYFQHQGHSRTIIGYNDAIEPRLIIIDPSFSKEKMSSLLVNKQQMKISDFFYGLSRIKEENYQIVGIEGVLKTKEAFEESKTITSIKIE